MRQAEQHPDLPRSASNVSGKVQSHLCLTEWRGKWKCRRGKSTLGAACPAQKIMFCNLCCTLHSFPILVKTTQPDYLFNQRIVGPWGNLLWAKHHRCACWTLWPSRWRPEWAFYCHVRCSHRWHWKTCEHWPGWRRSSVEGLNEGQGHCGVRSPPYSRNKSWGEKDVYDTWKMQNSTHIQKYIYTWHDTNGEPLASGQ